MLRTLHVKNLALIDEAEVDFEQGLNILTGETGAGKSIIIGSINLALGEKVPKEMLRDNEENAFVELIFEVDDPKIIDALAEYEVFPEDGQIIMSRRMTGGRSVARLNGESVPASKMKEISALLIDIHGQHEHQSLLKKHRHLQILDEYAKETLDEPLSKLQEVYREYSRIREELKELSTDDESRMRELSLLEYEIHEIAEARLREGEDEELELAYKKLSNGRKILEALGRAQGCLSEQNGSASELTGSALRELCGVSDYDEELAGMAEELQQIDSLLEDLNREMAAYMASEEFDEEQFRLTEQRLDTVNHLKSKYGHTIGEILHALEEKEAQAKKLRNFEEYQKTLQKQLSETEQTLTRLCEQVSAIRKKYAGELTQRVRDHLLDLNFLEVQFEMKFEKKESFGADGWDDVEFVIAMNPGEEPKSLGKVASGGELSRIMLALKTVLAENDEIDTLIFDEIDTGISGRTAQAVSEKMNLIAADHQIICITHLPQIAAMADAHFCIEKAAQNQTTISTIHRLEEDEIVDELARMLGGVRITETVLQSAKEMKELAQNTKNKQI
ncbi:MAG: DNA repair protein RecN [Lachnospiraceae bacterium]|nr:DNA repair protein RecN [Lachnospiraceae bacterium]